MDLSKKLVCYFASISLYIFLKQPCMNVPYFELTWWYASILIVNFVNFVILKLCQGDFARPKQNMSSQ